MNRVRKRSVIPLGRRRRLMPLPQRFLSLSGLGFLPLSGPCDTKDLLPPDSFPTLRSLERDYIEKVLRFVGDNRTRAAAILGIDRVSLWRKIKKYEIAAADSDGLEG
jgi:two-component system, NtrC family, response regulator AtoC